MGRPKKARTESAPSSGDFKMRSMILSLEPNLHKMVKQIAEGSDTAQPTVVKFILEKNKQAADDFMKELKQRKMDEERKELEAQKALLEKRIEKLTTQE